MQPEVFATLDDLCLQFEPAFAAWQQSAPADHPARTRYNNKTARDILADDVRLLGYAVARADTSGRHAELLNTAQAIMHLRPVESYLPQDQETSRLLDDLKSRLPATAPLMVPEALAFCREHAPVHAKPLAETFARVLEFLQIGDGNLTSQEFKLSTEFRKLLGL